MTRSFSSVSLSPVSLSAGLSICAVSLLAACNLERNINPSLGPEELSTTVKQYPDLPVPRELALQATVNQSRSYERGSFRTAMLEYLGAAPIDGVRSFVTERLPMHGWELTTDERPTHERILQRWAQPAQHVRYTLAVEIVQDGARTRLRYDLRTARASTGAGRAEPASGTRTPDAAGSGSEPKAPDAGSTELRTPGKG